MQPRARFPALLVPMANTISSYAQRRTFRSKHYRSRMAEVTSSSLVGSALRILPGITETAYTGVYGALLLYLATPTIALTRRPETFGQDLPRDHPPQALWCVWVPKSDTTFCTRGGFALGIPLARRWKAGSRVAPGLAIGENCLYGCTSCAASAHLASTWPSTKRQTCRETGAQSIRVSRKRRPGCRRGVPIQTSTSAFRT